MDYDIVIATRNRGLALKISIPLMLTQNKRPKNLIIVDSSFNHSDIKQQIENYISLIDNNINVNIIKSSPGSSYQRNIGLKYVRSEIVMLPDDDSLWFPNVASEVMKIYEKDNEQIIGAVCASESPDPPSGVIVSNKEFYRMSLKDRMQLIRNKFDIINKVEHRFFPEPFYFEGLKRLKDRKLPIWLDGKHVQLSPTIIGFKMSFRTEIIKKINFDEILGRYALFEDRDVALEILKNHLIVDALDAKVFHYRSPELRVSGDEWGVMSILNMAYIICKHTGAHSVSRNLLRRYCFYRGVRYLLQIYSYYGMRRAAGTWKAIMHLSEILNSSKDELAEKYLRSRKACLGGN